MSKLGKEQHKCNIGTVIAGSWKIQTNFQVHRCIRWKLAATQLGPLAVAKVQILMPGLQDILHLGLSRPLLMSAWGCTLLKQWRSCVSRPCGPMGGMIQVNYIFSWLVRFPPCWLACCHQQTRHMGCSIDIPEYPRSSHGQMANYIYIFINTYYIPRDLLST